MNSKAINDTKWHKLDNTAMIFPIISSKKLSSVFRVSANLKQEIVLDILKKSLEMTLPLFENFGVKLKHGLFWYYFETNKRIPIVEKEQDYPCAFMDPKTNNQFLFKVTYFNRRINLEVFHSITDGTGAMNFLKSLVFNYIKLANTSELSDEALKMPSVEVVSNTEDSYIKNYRKIPSAGLDVRKSYSIVDKKTPLSIISVIHGYINTNILLDFCKKRNVTITQYLTTVLIWCIYKEYLNGQPSKLPITISIPVNLRKFFSSTTSTNFFSTISVGFIPQKEKYEFEEILEIVTDQFKDQLTKENLSKKIFFNVSVEKNMFFRLIPLFIKNLILKIVYKFSEKANTSVLSNVGKVDVPIEFEKYIDSFSMLLGIAESESVKLRNLLIR